MTAAEERPFVLAAASRPRDDGPRLVLADFLDASPDPLDRARADLIRVQLALARLPHDHPRRAALAEEQTQLLQHLPAWTAPLAALGATGEFRRGLLDSVTVRYADLLHADRLFALAPIVRVRVTDAGQYAVALADCRHLARVEELDLAGTDLGPGGLNILLRSMYLTRVRTLDLSFNGLGDPGLRLLDTPALPRLRHLAVTDNDVTSDGLERLAASPQRADLRSLDLSGNAVDARGLEALAGGPGLRKLHTLRLQANPLGDRGVAVLANAPLLPRMLARDPRLDLRETAVGPAGAAALARSPALAAVTDLDLSDNELADEGLAALAGSPHLTALRSLSVRGNRVADRVAVALARSPLMSRLSALDLSHNRLTRRGLDAIFAARKDWRTAVEIQGNLAGEPADPDQPVPLTSEEVRRIVARYAARG